MREPVDIEVDWDKVRGRWLQLDTDPPIRISVPVTALHWWDWWRTSFTCRFRHGPIKPGTSLYGRRLRIQMEVKDTGEWVTVDERCRPVGRDQEVTDNG